MVRRLYTNYIHMPNFLRNGLAFLCLVAVFFSVVLMFISPEYMEAECFFVVVYSAMAALLLYHERDAD
jgi:hypothetical protein